jgi:hypothetical protein
MVAVPAAQGVWVQNLEIDVELPTANSSASSTNPDKINFDNIRFTSITALAQPTAKCGLVTPCQAQVYKPVAAPQNDGAYHIYSLQWNTPNDTFAGSLAFYVDGVLESTMEGPNIVPTYGHLWLGAWCVRASARGMRVCVCVCVFGCVRAHARGHECVCVCMCVCVRARACVRCYDLLSLLPSNTCTRALTRARMHSHVHAQVRERVGGDPDVQHVPITRGLC